jgi:ribonuclease BN (tRNA processing enzyme)
MSMKRASQILMGTSFLLTAVLMTAFFAAGQEVPPSHTRVVLLGTGNPAADPERSGPATAIVVNGVPYLVDLGVGVVRRAKSAAVDKGVTALEPTNLRVAFVTHLHSDHTAGYADFILTPWVLGRRVPLEVYGPAGIKSMTGHLLEAYRIDFETRTNPKTGSARQVPEGRRVTAHEISAGIVYKDANVTVTAFPTKHAMESFGYRFDTPDRRIVISGDTGPTQATIDACHSCDVLVHEVHALGLLAKMPDLRDFVAKYDTTTEQLADLATRANPRLLILYHTGLRSASNPQSPSAEELLGEITSRYSGRVVVGRDLDIY